MLRVPKVAEDRYHVVQMFDLFTYNFAYVGVRSTGFAAGDYLIAPTSWAGETPAEISDVLRTETQLAGTLTRTALFGADDTPNVRATARLRHPVGLRVRRAATSATGRTAGVSRLG